MANSNSESTHSDNASPKKVKYKLRPIFMQIIGSGMMIVGAVLVLLPLFTALTGEDGANNLRQVDFNPLESVEDQIEEGLSTMRVDASTISAEEKADLTVSKINYTGKWVATDYAPGDIGVGNYEVKLGDTLWEISEAVYSDGNQWGKILERNTDRIGYLPDGSQALIVPGQMLVIAK